MLISIALLQLLVAIWVGFLHLATLALFIFYFTSFIPKNSLKKMPKEKSKHRHRSRSRERRDHRSPDPRSSRNRIGIVNASGKRIVTTEITETRNVTSAGKGKRTKAGTRSGSTKAGDAGPLPPAHPRRVRRPARCPVPLVRRW